MERSLGASLMPFGLTFAEPLEVPFPAREVAEAVCERRQIAVFDGRPLCELMATDTPDSDPFYD